MRRYWTGLLLCGLWAGGQARADGQIFLCVDAGGRKELTDTKRGSNCKALDLPGAISAPPRRSAHPSASPPSSPSAAPAAYPKVDSAAQRARDQDRRQILQDELSAEQQKLADLQQEFNGGAPERQGDERNYAKYQERVARMRDHIGRTEKNIEALKREMATIR